MADVFHRVSTKYFSWIEILLAVGSKHIGYSHSQFAFEGSYSFNTSMLLLPWLVSRMTAGSTPSSFPILIPGIYFSKTKIQNFVELAGKEEGWL
jgi:hypothetical protein